MAMQKGDIQIIENIYIELSDGVKLSTRLWLPAGVGGDNPVPAIFEFLPYRKRDVTTYRDEVTYQVFAQNGYAGVRVDMRGCGDSTGKVQDEYVLQEQEDAVECINWIKKQAWCSGSVGMMGISWGGFNSLQVAYHAPDALKAIIPIAFTDDRYEGDIHYKGGVMMLDNIRWAANMEMIYSLPPDPMFTENWKEELLGRLSDLDPCVNKWLVHPLRDDYFKQGSVCEDFPRIKAATFLMAGMADSYSNNVMRTLSGLSRPKRAMIGPWVHLYPHLAVPGPRWDFCSEAIKWWDRWLKEKEPKQNEPEFLIYLQNRDPTYPRAEHVEGSWICDPITEPKMYYLKDGKLGNDKGDTKIAFRTKETAGFRSAGATWPTKLADLPEDQSVDDMESCYFETEPFSEDTSFCGNPVVHVSIASDKPVASVFMRLCKVNKAGESLLLSYTAWNLTHDASHETFTPLVPGEFKDVDIKLDIVSEKIEKDYRLRLCLATGMFPLFVPNPEPTTFTLDLNKCHINMPQLHEITPYDKQHPEPLNPSPLPTTQLSDPYAKRNEVTDYQTGRVTSFFSFSTGRRRFEEHELITEYKTETRDSILPDDPTSAQVHLTQQDNWSRGDDWRVNIVTTMDFTLDRDFYYTEETRTVKHNDEIIFSREYKNRFDRNPPLTKKV